MYLKEIQGLRVVAAVLVAIYHIWFQKVSGAVDAFFVIAGFFVFRSLFKGGIFQTQDIIKVYKRTLARIMPSASIVIVATCALFYTINFDSLWSDQIKNALASLVFAENWWLAFNSVDYLAREQMPSPFQQMWALSMQVQIYFVLPLVLLVIDRIARRFRLGSAGVPGAIAAVLLCSFVYAIISVESNQAFAYFDTFARVWEFLAGALLASILPMIKVGSVTARCLGYAGLIALMGFAAVYPIGTSFPGWPALVPVLATVSIIIASSNNANMRLLSAEPMQFLGNLSFTFYLWHWPLLIAYWVLFGLGQLSVMSGLAVMGLAAVLAYLTYIFAERPFRRSALAKGPALRSFVASGALMIPAVAAVGFWAMDYVGTKREAEKQLDAFRDGEDVHELIPATIIAKADIPVAYQQGCQQRWGRDEVIECVYGNADGRVVVVLVGGSHSLQWLPALREVARTHTDLKIISMTKGNCPFTLNGDELDLPEEGVCLSWNRQAIERIQTIAPNAVVTLLTTTRADPDGVPERIPSGFYAAWERLPQMPILAIRDTPRAPYDFVDCVDRHGPMSDACTVDRASTLVDRIIQETMLPTNIIPVDLTDAFCDNIKCPPARDGFLLYRDRTHVTATYARELSPLIAAALGRVGVLQPIDQNND